jgi:hypothetical protein
LAFTQSRSLPASLAFTQSRPFTASLAFAPSLAFTLSHVFTASFRIAASSAFQPSSEFTLSDPFSASAPFSASPTLPIPIVQPGGGADQIAAGLFSNGAIGAAAGGFAALAALLLLLLLKKKKKPVEEPNGETETETTLNSIDDDDVYISEYGLSDGVRPVDDSDDHEDLPQCAPGEGNYGSDIENASEHNPEFEDDIVDPDEA